jgi:hypothetical protein
MVGKEMIKSCLPNSYLEGVPVEQHPTAIARMAVLESLKFPFNPQVLARLALHDGDFVKETITTHREKFGKGGINEADIEVEAEMLNVFDLVRPEYRNE